MFIDRISVDVFLAQAIPHFIPCTKIDYFIINKACS